MQRSSSLRHTKAHRPPLCTNRTRRRDVPRRSSRHARGPSPSPLRAGANDNVRARGRVGLFDASLLRNVVATAKLGVPLDLKTIALHARNTEFNPKRFPAVIMRFRDPRVTVLVFRTGKIVCTGAACEGAWWAFALFAFCFLLLLFAFRPSTLLPLPFSAMSRRGARKCARVVQKLGFGAKLTDYKMQNVVATVDTNQPIRLEGLHRKHCFCTTVRSRQRP